MGRAVISLLLLAPPAWAARPELELEFGREDLAGVIDARLDEELVLLEMLITDHLPESSCDTEGPAARRRLADLRWEKSKRLFFRLEETSTDDRTVVRAAMEAQQELSLDGYDDLLASCPEHPTAGQTRFLLGSALVELGRAEEAADHFRAIIRHQPPDSPWLGNAWLMLGLHFFDHDNDAASADRALVRAEALGDLLTRTYAQFMRGWCAINRGDWPGALERFEQVARGKLAGRSGSALRREALGDYVRAYSHVAGPQRAWTTFVSLAGREQAPAMMVKLAAWYTEAGAHRQVVQVYRQLIARDPISTRLPLYWSRLVETLSLVDRAAAVEQAPDLAAAFAETRERARAEGREYQRQAARDLVEASAVAERTLRELATGHHADAAELHGRGKRRTLRAALVFYQLYLGLFPRPEPGAEADVGVRMRFNYAEALAALGEEQRAVGAYEEVIGLAELADSPKAREAESIAIEATVHLLRDLARAESRTQPATEAATLSATERRLIRAGERYVKHFGASRAETVAVSYLVGTVHYQHGNFEQALRIFADMVRRAPAHERACHAGGLILDIHNRAERWRPLRDAARSLRSTREHPCTAGERHHFLVVEQKADLNLIETELVAAGRHLEAARAQSEFALRFAGSELAAEALFAAGGNFDRAGRPEEAVAAWRTLAASAHASDDLVRDAIFAKALLFERIVRFVDAARELEHFARRFPRDARSRDALFNSAVYRAKLGHHRRARANRRTFVSSYPNDPAAPTLALDVCRSLAADDARGAGECFAAFADDSAWRRRDRDAVCVARASYARLLEDSGKVRGAGQQRSRLLREWNEARRDGVELPRCTAAVAALKLGRLVASLGAYRLLTIAELNVAEPRAKQRFYDSLRTKARARDALLERYHRIVLLGEPEWALAALFHMGEVHRDAVSRTLAASIPTEVDGVPLPEELRAKLRAKLVEIAAPSEKSAVELYSSCVHEAERLGVYGEWRSKARERLEQLRPAEFRSPQARLVATRFDDDLRVVENGFVVPDGDGWRGVDVELKR